MVRIPGLLLALKIVMLFQGRRTVNFAIKINYVNFLLIIKQMTLVLTFYKTNFLNNPLSERRIVSDHMIIIYVNELIINHIYNFSVPLEPEREILN